MVKYFLYLLSKVINSIAILAIANKWVLTKRDHLIDSTHHKVHKKYFHLSLHFVVLSRRHCLYRIKYLFFYIVSLEKMKIKT